MKAYLKQTRISPKKVNVVAALVRGKKVADALTMLKFTPKRSAPVLAKLIASAAANAENNFKQDREKLVISKILVNAGMTLKRGNPVSRGRWHPILKRTSRVTVELSPEVEKKVEKVEKASKVNKVEKVEKVKSEPEKKKMPKADS
ncbi:MAG: 50S ribosomal protein L22 [Candidatus Peribacteraceae bacterium]|nr:50S ribosomal protein L22 [Candidatus Peribacteraceae bacterium]